MNTCVIPEITEAGRHWMIQRLQQIEGLLRSDAAGSFLPELGPVDQKVVGNDLELQKLFQEQDELKDILVRGVTARMSDSTIEVGIGSVVKLVGMVHKRRAVRRVYVAGHYDGRIPWVNVPKDITVHSYDCVVGKALMRKTDGDTVEFRGHKDYPGPWEIDQIKPASFLKLIAAAAEAA